MEQTWNHLSSKHLIDLIKHREKSKQEDLVIGNPTAQLKELNPKNLTKSTKSDPQLNLPCWFEAPLRSDFAWCDPESILIAFKTKTRKK